MENWIKQSQLVGTPYVGKFSNPLPYKTLIYIDKCISAPYLLKQKMQQFTILRL